MGFNKLLEKQLKKYLPGIDLTGQPDLLRFLQAVNNSYEAYERNHTAEQRMRLALQTIEDNIWEYDFDKRRMVFAQVDKSILKLDRLEYVDQHDEWWDVIYEEDLPIAIDIFRKYKQGAISKHSIEYRIHSADGTVRWILNRGGVIERGADGRVIKIVGAITDIDTLKKAQAALRTTANRLSGLLASLNAGVLVEDGNGKIVLANQQFCNLFAIPLPPEALAGMDCAEYTQRARFLFRDQEGFLHRVREIVDKREALAREELQTVDGKVLERTYTPLFIDGRYEGHLWKYSDITSRKQAELELTAARHAAEESARAKENFLANMSHEIRTPISAILGMSRQLGETGLNAEQAFFLGTINKASEHLLVIINDILDISKIEAGMLQLECIGFRLHEVVGQVLQVMMIRAEEKGLALSMEVQADPSLVLLGDPFRLKQVLLNLVSNSIKFTEKGGVTITCRVRATRPGRVEVMLSVTDTGIGMEPAFLQTIFENFTQNDKTTARKYGGTGLGMSICKQLVEMMGGYIEVKSQVNAGTTVTFRVPFSTGAEKDIPGREKLTANTSILRNCRVLLVEDNDINQLIASIILRKYGLHVTAVNNGKEAVEALAAASFDVVLMDMQMPVMDGLEATAYIRGYISKQVPIIALTANAIKGENERCINAGMNDYISKPFEEELLINTIAHWVKTEKTPAIPGRLYSLQKLEKMCGGDKHFLDKMVRLFLEQIPPAAAQIAAAYGNNDFITIAFLAHRIKPTLDNMDIHSLYYGVRRIEVLAKEGRATPEFSQLVAQLQSVIEEVATSLSLHS